MKVLWSAMLAALAAVFGALTFCTPAGASSGSLTVTAVVNGVAVGSSTAGHPVRLEPSTPATVAITVVNNGTDTVTLHRVQLAGRVLGLTFYSFDTSVSLDVAAGSTQTLNYSLELTGLHGQATGLMNGAVTVFGPQDHELARQVMVTDVRGSWWSVYGLFGFALLLLTVLALLDVSLSIARHRMPANRFRRGLRVMTPGIGIGLILVFTLSAVRVWAPTTQRWLLIAAIFAAVFFVLGYLSPTPAEDVEEPDDEEDGDGESVAQLDDATTVMAPVAASPSATLRPNDLADFPPPPPPPPPGGAR